jgi:peptidoglycan/xylan/chitin deacetylase (PgdA/CDA1 family)
MPVAHPIVSFTFDDFPRSALLLGGRILEEVGVSGTYFVSRGLMDQTGPSGKLFNLDDLTRVSSSGHELGCHTFHHCPAWDTPPYEYESSVVQNAAALEVFAKLQTHSYPISNPRPATKRRVGRHFRGCRSGGQRFNHGTIDLNGLNSFFLEQSCNDFAAVEKQINANADAGGWLIFSTHDVGESPTRFGCSPMFFDKIVKASIRSGAKLMVMSAALDELRVPGST